MYKAYQLIESLKLAVSGYKKSQYDEETGYEHKLSINGNFVQKKGTSVFFFDVWWNIDSESKMLSNSLFKKYLLIQINKLILTEDFQEINQRLDLASEEFLSLLEFNSIELEFSFDTLNSTSLPKLLQSNLFNNGLIASNHNLSMLERLRIFMDLSKKIAKDLVEENIIVIIDLPILNQEIKQTLINDIPSNLFIFCITSKVVTHLNATELLVVNNKEYDLMCEDTKVQIMEDYGLGNDFSDLDHKLGDAVNNTIEEKSIYSILE